ncbi:hypothetical protein HYC85_029267 [Camellia sinensis]|uniref:Aminotransferase-like plant mobile domain-containing protein n=1 Tax=Camellia sinensis TaxID=4442 RepID=A0A7J7G1J8_CAMSI|nr:hypothetical protein HYC85_029267 [Camellia sinensis]
MVPETPEETEQYARGFLMFLFGTSLFADRGNTVGLYLLSALVDLSQVHRYDWGGAGLATLYFYMSATSRGRGDLLGGYWRAWEPWAPLGDGLRLQYTGGSDISQYRVLLEGPVGRAWFLGERFLRQVWGYLSQDPPAVPPVSMRTADRLSYSEVVSAMLGSDALLYLEEGDYATYRHIYLMPPLTGARTPMTRPAGMSSSGQARARAADAPSTSRAGTSRGGGRPVPLIPSTYPHPGWPDMLTELMAWQYGAISPTPIPLEPPMPSDRYAIDPDSPLPPRGYMEEVVGLVATLEGMVLRREAQLSVAGIQMPSWSGQPQAKPPGPPWGAGSSGPFQGVGSPGPFQGAGPSRPFRGAGPSRPFRGARGGPVRRRRAHVVEAEPDEEEEDAEEEEEEATDRQSETSAEEGGFGLGSGNRGEAEGDPEDDSSDSDDDDGAEVVPQKRMRSASRSRSRGH